jgi:hypothetical protein
MSGIGFLGEVEIMDYLKKNLSKEIYIPLKDVGIDFGIVKSDIFYLIQVKTSTFQKGSYFWFDLHKKKMVYKKNAYYIFVCKSLGRRNFMDKKTNFFIIPSLELKDWINSGKLATKHNSNEIFNIFLYPNFKEKRWFYKNKGKQIEWTKYWNNLEELK